MAAPSDDLPYKRIRTLSQRARDVLAHHDGSSQSRRLLLPGIALPSPPITLNDVAPPIAPSVGSSAISLATTLNRRKRKRTAPGKAPESTIRPDPIGRPIAPLPPSHVAVGSDHAHAFENGSLSALLQSVSLPRRNRRGLLATGDHANQRTFYAARDTLADLPDRHSLGRMDVSCQYCGAYHWFEEKLSSSPKSHPLFSTCCQRGHVDLPFLPDPPPFFRDLLEGSDAQSVDFRQNIRQYNMSLAFTSLGVTEDRSVNRRGGWVFRISGELCHLVGSLRPDEGVAPSFAQLYIYDSRLALLQRLNRNNNLREDTMTGLQDMLLTHHRYAHDFRHAYEVLREFPDAPNAEVRLRVLPGQSSRVYDAPSSDEVAVILPGDGTAPERRDIILRPRSSVPGELARINDGHPAYSPLHYVLLFPHGTNGWHYDLRHRVSPGSSLPPNWNAPRISQTQYAAFRLHTRENEFPSLHRAGRLFQQYVVDMWASADQTRLSYLRYNQGRLRAAVYSGMEDWLRADEIVDPHELGRRTVLPSSYIGGPRSMQQRYQDAMAIARFFGNVDLFITMTTNPDWVEIQRELLPGQTAYDRPDLVARVFILKKDELIADIYKRKIFGSVSAYVYVVEFQKRGLPHVHILVILDKGDRLLTQTDIDSCISAQWPDPEKTPDLFATVKSCMVHGPCGNINPNSPCMKNGRCSKGYPKAFQDVTSTSDNGYPLYARPDDSRSFPIKVRQTMFDVDNRWIVPYNPYLSAKYNCHINVESVASFKTLKYCFKYVHKGPDRAMLEYNRDEIKSYIDGRYIGAPEAVWRTFHFPIHEQFPPVVRLQVHLPGQHMVLFDPDEPIETITARAASVEARKFTYQDFPKHFVWNKSKKKWSLRQQGFSLGRMYFVPPTGGERFYLRTLLTVVRGPKSFQDLRTFDDVVYPTFQDACKARGLLEDDGEWRLCLSDAAAMQGGKQLRHLFSTILIFCQVSSPESLWNEFRDSICDDLHIRIPNPTPERIYDYGLFLIDRILSDSGHSLQNFPHMPLPQINWTFITSNRLILDQLDYNVDEERQFFEQHMENVQHVPEQLDAYNSIVACIDSGQGGVFFLNGAGGTGKTYLYRTLCHKLRSEGKIVLCVASSGIAALLLPGGHTAHSTFRIPINNLDADSTCNISKEELRADLLRAVDLIIWDEALMQNRYTHEALDRTMRDICDKEDLPFGGKTVVFGGDFQQTLPVIPGGSKDEIVSASLPCSYLWKSLKVLSLRVNMRLCSDTSSEELRFADWLLSVGHGVGIDEDGTIPFDPRMRVTGVDALIESIYPHLEKVVPPAQYFLDRIILAPRNTDVTALNASILDKMPGTETVLYSADSVEEQSNTDDALPVEFLRSIDVPGLPPGELHLKTGCPLILLRNLAPTRGLCNGTRMILRRATHRLLEVEIIGGEHHGELAFIPRITLIPSAHNGLKFLMRRRQFPVRLAFALTINKAQGQSVQNVGLDLREPVFTHGQLYVALSRVTSSQRIKMLLPPSTAECRVHNVVYPEIFHIL